MRGKELEGRRRTRHTKLMVGLAVIFVLCSYCLYGYESNMSSSSIVGLLFMLAAIVTGALGFFMSIFDIGAAPKGRRKSKVLFMAAVPLIGLSSLVLGSALFMPQNLTGEAALQTGDQVIAASGPKPVVQDPEIKQLLISVGAKGDYTDLSMRWADDMQAECDWAGAAGCYKSDGIAHELIMKRGIDAAYMKVSAAHEFLHYMWYKNELDKDTRLTSYLIDFYGKNPSFQKRINSHYVDNGALKPTEFFSYGCTEVSDARLGAYIAGKCNEYIDTSKLPAMY